ncbi:hypothetical protein SAMN05192539_10078 [Paraburkholderia diazotrophica]|uniref:Uncharacterized protein n=1 Tax=Paraburkholderia diazotrophica TaxID=667676 RepID=A0A1H6W8Q4_9BURK|nr:hypothetical protein SAMN05192539_10078 [Paraburkholderia diazotrophica]
MKSVASLRTPGVWGTGTLVMLADTDVGNVVAAAQAGTASGYRLLPLLFVLVPLLYFVPFPSTSHTCKASFPKMVS